MMRDFGENQGVSCMIGKHAGYRYFHFSLGYISFQLQEKY